MQRTANPENRAAHYAQLGNPMQISGLESRRRPGWSGPEAGLVPAWRRQQAPPMASQGADRARGRKGPAIDTNKGADATPSPSNEKSRKRGPFVSQKTRAANAALAVTQIFFFGAIIMTICRPSRRGRDSTTMSSPRSASIRAAISRPSS